MSLANQADEMMNKANEFYQQNKFEKAADLYQKLVDENYEGTALYYNLGNAYYKLNKIGYAILNYEKALRLSPGDDDVQHNLALANSKTADKIDTLPQFFLFNWWESLLALFSVSEWTWAAYSFYLILLISIGAFFFIRNPRVQRYSLFTSFGFGVIFLLTAVLLVINLNRDLNVKDAIITEPAVTVKLAPDKDSNDAFVVHEGLKIRVMDKVDNWLKIRLNDGKIGWMPENDLKII
jgi:tetratricopeptide (TPR) repeat protein